MHAHTQHTHARTYDTLAFHHPQSQQDGRNFFTLVALSQGCYEPSIPLYSGQQYQSQSEIYDFSNQKSFPGWQFVIWIYLAIARHGNLRSKSCLAPPSEIHQRLSRFTLRFARCTLEASWWSQVLPFLTLRHKFCLCGLRKAHFGLFQLLWHETNSANWTFLFCLHQIKLTSSFSEAFPNTTLEHHQQNLKTEVPRSTLCSKGVQRLGFI